MYDYDSCPCEQAAWRVYDLMCEHEPMYFEAHVTDDEESPNGFGWYFSSHLRNADGTWSEYDGGQYWDYESAEELIHPSNTNHRNMYCLLYCFCSFQVKSP